MARVDRMPHKLNEAFYYDEHPKHLEVEATSSGVVEATATLEDIQKKISNLKNILEKDPNAADLKWSFFVSACHTYRYDTCLRPFPPMYIRNECKDFESLRRAVEVIPPLAIIQHALAEPNVYEIYGPAIELLYWVLIRLREPQLKSINKEHFDSVLRNVPCEMKVAPPTLIFQVTYSKQSSSEEKWRAIAKGCSTFFAYHGSRLENFHSIIHHGLQQTMCKKSFFGTGIYFSSELGVSLPYSPVGYGWGGSILGSDLSCVALCELINHPNVKRGDSSETAKPADPDAIGGKVPNKYCLVMNSDLVRIRYLLVYSREFRALRKSKRTGFLAWLMQHKLLTFVFGYVVLLASVGLTHNKNVEKYYKLLIQKVGLD